MSILDRYDPERRFFLFMPAPGDGGGGAGGSHGGGDGGVGGAGGHGDGPGDSTGGPSGTGGAGIGDGRGGDGPSRTTSTSPTPTPAPAPSSSSRSSGGSSSSAWSSYMKKMWGKHLSYIKPIYKQMREIMKTQWEWALEDRERWETMFKPLEDALVADAKTFASQGKRELEAGRAASEVSKAFSVQREAARRQLEGYGIDPSQTRSQALDLAGRLQQGAAGAAASNRARQNVDEVGRRLRAEAINIGDITKHRALQEAQASAQTGAAAGGLMNSAFSIGANYILGGGNLDLGYAKLAESARQFNESLAFEKLKYADQTDTGGVNIGSILLSGLEGYANAGGFNNGTGVQVTDYQAPAQPNYYQSTPGGYNYEAEWGNPSFSEGGKVEDGFGPIDPNSVIEEAKRGMEWASQQQLQGAAPVGAGIPAQLPATAAPQAQANWAGSALPRYDGDGSVEGVGGPKDDMVPARLSPGEYVMPEEVVSWKGEEFFVKLREKARADMQEEQAVNPPKFLPAIGGR